MKKRPSSGIAALTGLAAVAICLAWFAAQRGSTLQVKFVGFTNSPVAGECALFTVTNTGFCSVRRWAWEVHSGAGRDCWSDAAPVILRPGDVEHLRVPACALPRWRLAVLSTGSWTWKEIWDRFLMSTPYVATNQLDALQFDRTYSQWVFPAPNPAP